MLNAACFLEAWQAMLKAIVWIAIATSCGVDDKPLPSCADVGCGSETGFCSRDGVCECPQVDADPIQCQREPATFRPDAGVDSM